MSRRFGVSFSSINLETHLFLKARFFLSDSSLELKDKFKSRVKIVLSFNATS